MSGKPSIDATDLTLRTKRILRAVVSEYLQTGDAVGSRTVTRRHDIDLSPATVRNVMSDLEEMGLLSQPHTSAGRVPTGKGLRIFIDSLLKVRGLSAREKEEIRRSCGVGSLELDDVFRHTSQALSDFTSYAGIVLAPNPEDLVLEHIEFVRLGERKYLCVLVTANGAIENKLITTEVDIEPGELERVHNYLTEQLGGLTLEQVRGRVIRDLGEDKSQFDRMVAAALALSKGALNALEVERNQDVIVTGGVNLLEYARSSDPDAVERMRALLRTLEEKEIVARMLDKAMSSERVQVFLGAESGYGALESASVVATPFRDGDRAIGAMAVIGPTRMNYGKVMSVVDFTAEVVSRLLTGGS